MNKEEVIRAYVGAQDWSKPIIVPQWMMPYAKEYVEGYFQRVKKAQRKKRRKVKP